MAYKSPKTGSKINPGKRKKLPQVKKGSKRNAKRKNNLKAVGKLIARVGGHVLPFRPFPVQYNAKKRAAPHKKKVK